MKRIPFTPVALTMLILCISPMAMLAQEQLIDSLFELVAKDKPACASPCMGDTTRVRNLNDLSWELKYVDPDSAIVLSTEALHLAEQMKYFDGSTGWQMGIGASLNQLGGYYWIIGDYAHALQNYSEALTIWEKLLKRETLEGQKVDSVKVLSGKSSLLGNMGNIYMHKSDFVKALDYYLKALKMDEAISNEEGIARHLGNIGAVYSSLKDYEHAFDYQTRALKMDEEAGNKEGVAMQLGNIGGDKMEQGRFAEALDYYNRALKIQEELGQPIGMAAIHDKIGNVYAVQRDFANAHKHYFKALELNERTGNPAQLASILYNLGTSYVDLKDYRNAEKYLKQALAVAEEIGFMSHAVGLYSNLSEMYQRMGNYKSALEYFETATAIKDSLFSEEKNDEITEMGLNYEFEKKTLAIKAEQEKKDALASAEISKQLLIRNIILGGVVLAAILAFLGIRSVNRRKKLAFEKTVSEVETKALRAQMNPHFISNSLQSINKYIIDNEKEHASDYLSRFAKLMRLILENSREAEVTIEKDLSALELYLQLEALRFNHKFKYEIKVDPEIDSANTLIPPLLIQPFVENSIQHGIRSKEDGFVNINVRRDANMLHCTIEDNGIGRGQAVRIETGEEKRESLGMKITQERLSLINQTRKVNAAVNVFDKKNNENIPQGLRVELLLPFEQDN